MVVSVCVPERMQNQPRTDDLRKTRRNCRARDLQLEDGDKKKVQNGVHDRADDEEQKGPLRVSERAENAAPHVVDHGGDHARKVPDEVVLRVLQRIFRRIERGKKQGCDGCAKKRRERAHHDGQKHRRMHGLTHLLVLLRARVLRDDDGSAGRQADKEIHDQINEHNIRPADCRERGFADELAEHDRIDRGVELLEKRSQHDRQEERQHPLQNGAFGHGALMEQRALHENSPFGANRKYLRSVDTIILIFRAFARGHGKYFRRKNFRESGLDETECFPYNKDEPHTIEHRGAGKPAEIAHRACPLT